MRNKNIIQDIEREKRKKWECEWGKKGRNKDDDAQSIEREGL